MARLTAIQAAAAQDEEAAVLTIYQKDGEPYLGANGAPLTVSVLGSESTRYKRARDRLTQRAIRNRTRRMSSEELRANRIEQAAAVVVAWTGVEDDNDVPLACTLDNVKIVLGTSDSFLEQVEAGIAGHADFFGTASTSSAPS